MLAASEPPKLRVLVVDGDVDTVDSTAKLLRLGGHHVETVANGRDAISRTIAFIPHVITLDIAMPAMNGYKTAHAIQQLALPNPPVLVAVSGYADAVNKRRSAEAGFDLYLSKPVEPHVFGQLSMLAERPGFLAEQVARLSLEHY